MYENPVTSSHLRDKQLYVLIVHFFFFGLDHSRQLLIQGVGRACQTTQFKLTPYSHSSPPHCYCHVKCLWLVYLYPTVPRDSPPLLAPLSMLLILTALYLLLALCRLFIHWVQEKHFHLTVYCTLYMAGTVTKIYSTSPPALLKVRTSVRSKPDQSLHIVLHMFHYWTFTFLDSSSWCRPTTTKSPSPERNTYMKILWEENDLVVT